MQQRVIYPTFADPAYDPAVNLVATCAGHVPLLWFAMFRPADLVTQAFETDDGPYVVVAPVTTRQQALKNLAAALSRLDELFPEDVLRGTWSGRVSRSRENLFRDPLFPAGGALRGYAGMLAEAVGGAPGPWVTVEWDEIDVITAGDLTAEATAAMVSLEPATVGDPATDRARLLWLSGLDRTNPPATAAREGRLRTLLTGLHSG
jgi:hypothetical protein